MRKSHGPLVCAGDLVVKLLARHHVAAFVQVDDEESAWPEVVRVQVVVPGRVAFAQAVESAAAIVGRRCRVALSVEGDRLVLPPDHWVNQAGSIRPPPIGKVWRPPVVTGLVTVNFRRPELEPGYAERMAARRR